MISHSFVFVFLFFSRIGSCHGKGDSKNWPECFIQLYICLSTLIDLNSDNKNCPPHTARVLFKHYPLKWFSWISCFMSPNRSCRLNIKLRRSYTIWTTSIKKRNSLINNLIYMYKVQFKLGCTAGELFVWFVLHHEAFGKESYNHMIRWSVC